jgi:hypothetical protein
LGLLISEEDLKTFNRLYFEEDYSLREAAGHFGVDHATLKYRLKKSGVKLRGRLEAIELASRKGKYIKEGCQNPNYKDGEWIKYGRWLVYGLTKTQYDLMLKESQGKCNICNEVFTSTPNIDHCHSTGEVRGLLCSHCNRGLGCFKDNEVFMDSAIEYLRSSRARWG